MEDSCLSYKVRQQRLSACFPCKPAGSSTRCAPSSKCPERPRKALNLSPKPVPKKSVSDDFAALRSTTSFGGLNFALQLAPASRAVVGDDLFEHRSQRGRIDVFALADGQRARALVLVAAGEDSRRIRDDGAVVEKQLTWSFAANSAQMLPCSTKYGRLVRLIVSATSWSAAWTRSRTSRQMACCQSGRASM